MTDYDIVIVGYGPVGQTAAALLGKAGHRVAVIERFGSLYDLPRAVVFDHEIMRIWQALGIVDELEDDLLPTNTYDWFGADGEPILEIRIPETGPSGWAATYLFYQPHLDTALDRAAKAQPRVELHRNWAAESLTDTGEHVELGLRRLHEPRRGELETTDETRTVSARYVIGADGANSFVRRAVGIEFDDLGFAEHVLTVDLRPDDMEALGHLPTSCQWCDPARPHMHTRNGRAHRRFEFSLLPGETPAQFDDEDLVWDLLAPFMTPDDGKIVRSAVYEFRSRLARTMRAGRVLIAGDAAKTTPPFMGQGMCSGIRDATNAAWRLDLVLRGLASDELLDGYSEERRPHNEFVVNVSSELGRISCQLDPVAAAERDTALRAAGPPPPLALPALDAGGDEDGVHPLVGTQSVQGTIAAAGREGRADDVAGHGFTLVARGAVDTTALADLDLRVIDLSSARDVDGRLTAWLDEHDAAAVLVRPDFYVLGAVRSLGEAPALLADARRRLSLTDQGAPVIRPAFHHVNLKTTRLQEMIDFYSALVGCEVLHQYDMGAWISNDAANHRIALLAFPNFTDDPEKETRTGLHHTAFEYAGFEELDDSYQRLKAEGITPAFCLDHGMTFSYYYADPDGNHVELQIDNFGDWAKSAEWMRSSPEFAADPLGKFVDPDRVSDARASGASFAEIHERAMAGELAPATPGVELPVAEA